MTIRKESVAVITGAGSGIGRALALRFAAEDVAGIAIADVNADGLAETEKLLGGKTRLPFTQSLFQLAKRWGPLPPT